MNQDYTFHWLSDDLLLIVWHRTSLDREIPRRYIRDLQEIMDDVDHPLYFLSDLREGRITDMRSLLSLAKLTKHRNWGGGAAFSSNPMTKVFVDTVRRLSSDIETRDGIFHTPEEAVAYLESLKSGIADGIDWDDAIKQNG